MEKLKAFLNQSKVKSLYLKRIQKHRKLDHLEQGIYFESNGETKGCAVGCTLNYDNSKQDAHKRYESELGIPEWLAYLEDKIFEGLTVEDSKAWPEDFLKAIPIGFDKWDRVRHKFLYIILMDKKHGCITRTDGREDVKKAIENVANLHQLMFSKSKKPAAKDWSAAECAAGSAGWSAARSAHYKWMSEVLLKIIKEESK